MGMFFFFGFSLAPFRAFILVFIRLDRGVGKGSEEASTAITNGRERCVWWNGMGLDFRGS